MRLECRRAGSLLEAEAAGLSDADRLRLEEHLAGCHDCGEDAAMLSGIRRLSDLAVEPLPAAARERVLARALAEVALEGASGSAPRVQQLRWALATSALVSAAAAATLWLVLPDGPEGRQPTARGEGQQPTARGEGQQPTARGPAASTAAAATAGRSHTEAAARTGASDTPLGDRVLAGDLALAGRPVTAGAAVASDAELQTELGAELALAHGRVRLEPGSVARWSAGDRTLHLSRGRVVARVDPGPGQRFAVATEHFTAVVLGTHFEVSNTEVVVHRGRVRVEAPDGRALTPVLGAGERWQLDAAVIHDETAARKAEKGTDDARGPDARKELAAIRATLAAGDSGRARSRLAVLMRGRLSGAQRAEALSLRAECGLVEGDLESAVADYLRVAKRYRKGAAGENALFAAGRLEARRGRGAAARTLFQRYLARYPGGRFERDAQARLRELAP